MVRRALTSMLLFAGVVPLAFSQSAMPTYEKTDAMIPMRDGIKLNTVIFTPKESKEELPFLFLYSASR